MTQLACEGADTAALADKLCVIHTQRVHPTRTLVNVDCVRTPEDKVYVPIEETTGEAIARLRARSGLSMRAFALAAGYSHASGVQRYVDAGFTKRLDLDVATKMADALEGHGDPAITRAEVMALTGLPIESNALPFRMEGASERRMTHDVPVYGTALGADEIIDGEAIEQTTLNQAEVIGYIRRPVLLDGRADVYGLYVQGQSMAPRYRDGATLFVERKKPPRIGDDVVVYLRAPDEHDGERPSCVLIKTLVRKTASYIELEQYTPALQFRIPVERVGQMDRVLTLDELVA